MKPVFLTPFTRHFGRRMAAPYSALPIVLLMALLMALTQSAWAGPGAHGPNGEHLDSPAPTSGVSRVPRVEAHTDLFELVAELRQGEWVLVLDRYDSNEPVLGARLEVETGAIKALASFRPEQGDYVFNDPALVKALAIPGEHSLVFTLAAGQDNDLLDATLHVAADSAHSSDDHDHDRERALWALAGLGSLGLLGGFVLRRRRQAQKLSRPGGQ